jgi:alpha-1,3-rhamnosyl/mannosyltransferase
MVSNLSATEVVLDAQTLSSVASGGGVSSYTRHLMGALAERGDVSLTVLCGADVPVPAGVRRVTIHRVAHRARLEVMEHALRGPVELRRHRPAGAVFHNPSFHAPVGVRGPWVQTLHDVIPLVFDSPDVAALRARWKRFGPRYLRADAVIAISRHAADEGVRLLGLDPAKVTVATHGVDPIYSPGEASGMVADRPYLLVVSEYSVRKGFAEAFAVMDGLVDAGYPHRLVVAGRVHSWATQELAELHAAARHPERIELRGFVPDLVELYRGASAFLMTSRYEGFGLPPLEAMGCGLPVVAFANSSVTEVVSGGGLLVDDGDVAAMLGEVRRIIDSPSLAAELKERSVAHAKTFTWERCAAVHAEVYRSVAV